MENQQVQGKAPWYDNKILTNFLLFIFFPVGLYALWKSNTIAKWWKITASVLIGLIVIGQVSGGSKSGSSKTETKLASVEESKKMPTIGETINTGYFDVTVNKVELVESVNTGNEFADLKAEEGNRYLVISATFKNVDNESRMLQDGSVWIDYNGKNYEFDKSESIMLDGWGIMLDQLNPLTKKTTNIVYKIPAEIKGNVIWEPGRNSEGVKFSLGHI